MNILIMRKAKISSEIKDDKLDKKQASVFDTAILSPVKKYEVFGATLNKPVQVNPKLKRLPSEPDIFGEK